jgi:hypothetical protein
VKGSRVQEGIQAEGISRTKGLGGEDYIRGSTESSLILLLFFFYGAGVGTQGFAVAKQELYHLSYTSSPFYSGYFGDGGLELSALASFEL